LVRHRSARYSAKTQSNVPRISIGGMSATDADAPGVGFIVGSQELLAVLSCLNTRVDPGGGRALPLPERLSSSSPSLP
jgi:hypothetical protein